MPVAQLDRVFGYEPKGQGFESLQARQTGSGRSWRSGLLFLPRIFEVRFLLVMKWKVFFALLALLLLAALSLAGCGASVADPNSSALVESSASMDISQVRENNLDGLLAYLQGNGLLREDTKEMKAEIIGAVAGKMVQCAYGDETSLAEIYEFDTQNLGEMAQTVIADARDHGKYRSIDGEMTAVMSDNGRFLMIYKDVHTDEAKGPVQKRLLKLFAEFEPTDAAQESHAQASSEQA